MIARQIGLAILLGSAGYLFYLVCDIYMGHNYQIHGKQWLVERKRTIFLQRAVFGITGAPFVEEAIFRGLPLLLAPERWRGPALLITCVPFVIHHVDRTWIGMRDWLARFFVGAGAFAVPALVTGSIWPSVAAHAIWNLGFFIRAYRRQAWSETDRYISWSHRIEILFDSAGQPFEALYRRLFKIRTAELNQAVTISVEDTCLV